MEIMEIYLFDKNKEVIDILPAEDLHEYMQEQELNAHITADVSGLYKDSVEDAHFFGSQDVDDRSIFWRYKIAQLEKDGNTFNLKGMYELFDDLKSRAIIEDRRPTDWSAIRGLETLLEGTGWQVGNVVSNHRASTNWYWITPLEAFWDYLDKWNVEYKPRMVFDNGKVVGKYIDIQDKLSGDYGKWYEHGDKLLEVVAEEKSDNIYTAFYGRGKGLEIEDDTGEATGGYGRKLDFATSVWENPVSKPVGQKFVEIPWATAEYGYEGGNPRYTVVEFPDIEDSDELLQATYDYALNEIRPKSQYSAVVQEDKLADLGEIVAVIRDDNNIRYKTRIFKLLRDFLNKDIKRIEFGDELIPSRAKQAIAVGDAIKKQEDATMSLLDQLRQQIINSYFNNDGYNYDLKAGNEYELPGGYYSFDAPIDQHPTKVIYIGAGQMLIANSKLPNGEWDFKTAATADGLYADRIVGTNADLVRASFNAIGTSTQIEAGNINVMGSGTYRRNIMTETGIELFNGLGASNRAGGVGYFKSIPDQAPHGTYQFNKTGAKHSIGMAANASHDLVLGYNPSTSYTTKYKQALQVDGDTGLIRLFEPISTGGSTGYSMVLNAGLHRGSPAIGWQDGGSGRGRVYLGENTTYLESGVSTEFYAQSGRHLLTLRDAIIARQNIFMDGHEITGQSDVRLKDNVKDADLDVRNEFKQMRPIEFEWKKNHPVNKNKPTGKQVGIQAQYSPFLQVKQGQESYLSISHTKQTTLNSMGVKELYEENEQLKNELDELRNEITSIKELLKKE